MKKKYQCMDKRTGYEEGEIVELTMDELNRLPFNVFMKGVDEKKDVKKIEGAKLVEDKSKLRKSLLSKGLSHDRSAKVVEKYSSLTEMMLNASKGGFDSLTNDFLKKEYVEKMMVKSKSSSAKKEKGEK